MRRVGQMLLCCAVCFLLVSCGLADMPRSDDIKNALQGRLVNDEYTIDSVILMEEYVYEDAKTAYQCCEVVSSNDTCKKTEEVKIYYSYIKGKWQIDSVDVQGDINYELLRDLEQDQCRSLLLGRLPSNAEVTELFTDRSKKTALATIAYQKHGVEFGAYGSVTTDGVMEAKFHWDPGGWKLSNLQMTDETKYIYDVQCHIQRDADSMWDLTSESFSLGFDLKVESNVVTIQNTKYSAKAWMAGKMKISNARVGEESDESKLVVYFDFERDADELSEESKRQILSIVGELRSTSGVGSVVLYGESAGNIAGTTRLKLDNWTQGTSGWREREYWVERS